MQETPSVLAAGALVLRQLSDNPRLWVLSHKKHKYLAFESSQHVQSLGKGLVGALNAEASIFAFGMSPY